MSNEFPVLIGDIGGTNARFQILPDADEKVVDYPHVKTENFDTIDDAIVEAVLEAKGIFPKSVILAAAGPITAKGLNLTNCHWNIIPNRLLDRIGASELVLFNDFDAQALALPHFSADQLVTVGDGNFDEHQESMTKAVLGPGTGLGVAALLRANDQWVPMGGEGGHVDLGPRNKREEQIWGNLDRFDGRVSAESILCGAGIRNAYQAICQIDGLQTSLTLPEDISAAAMTNADPSAKEALELFCTMLGRVAGDLALTTMAKGGIYVAGGIVAKILPFLQQSGFRQAFEDKAPHSKLLTSISTHVVTTSVPALTGLAAFAKNSDLYSVSLANRKWRR